MSDLNSNVPQSNSSASFKGKISQNEKNLVVSFIQFLRRKVSSNECNDEQIEALEGRFILIIF